MTMSKNNNILIREECIDIMFKDEKENRKAIKQERIFTWITG